MTRRTRSAADVSPCSSPAWIAAAQGSASNGYSPAPTSLIAPPGVGGGGGATSASEMSTKLQCGGSQNGEDAPCFVKRAGSSLRDRKAATTQDSCDPLPAALARAHEKGEAAATSAAALKPRSACIAAAVAAGSPLWRTLLAGL